MYEEDALDMPWYTDVGAATGGSPQATTRKRKRDADASESRASFDDEDVGEPRDADDTMAVMDDSVLAYRMTTTNFESLHKLFTCIKEIAGNTHALIQCTKDELFITGMSKLKDAHMTIQLRQMHQVHLREDLPRLLFSVYPREFVKQFRNIKTGSSLSWYVHENDLDEHQSPIELHTAIVSGDEDDKEIMFHAMRVSRPTDELSPVMIYHEYGTQLRCSPKELQSILARFTLEKEQSATKQTFITLSMLGNRFSAFSSNHNTRGMYVRESKNSKELQIVRQDRPEDTVSVMFNYKSFLNLLKCSVLNMPCVIMLENNMPLRLKFELGRNNEANFFLHPVNASEKSDTKLAGL